MRKNKYKAILAVFFICIIYYLFHLNSANEIKKEDALIKQTNEYQAKMNNAEQCMREKSDGNIKIMQDTCIKSGKDKYCQLEGTAKESLEVLKIEQRKECFEQNGLDPKN